MAAPDGQVALIRWPGDESALARARAAHRPRLLLVAPAAVVDVDADPLEDWVRLPASDEDIALRVRTLAERARVRGTPRVADGIVTYEGEWVTLSPVEERLAHALSERFGSVVGRDVLVRTVWPVDPPSRNALDVHILRLRRRIEGLGLEIRTVRSRGYLLQAAAGPAGAPPGATTNGHGGGAAGFPALPSRPPGTPGFSTNGAV